MEEIDVLLVGKGLKRMGYCVSQIQGHTFTLFEFIRSDNGLFDTG